MYRQVVPRVCRQVKNCHVGVRGYGYRRELPIRWIKASPWDHFSLERRPFFRSNIDDHFREMKRKMFADMMGKVSPKVPYNRTAGAITRTETAEVKYDTKVFEVKVDVQQYEPEHLKVSMVENRLVISGKHETKADEHGYISREFSREFIIPENVDAESIASRLTEEGYLVIEAKVKGSSEVQERVIEIQKAGKSGGEKTE